MLYISSEMLGQFIMDINKILKIHQFKAVDIDESEGMVLITGELINTCKSCPVCKTVGIKPHQYHNKMLKTVPFNDMPTYLLFVHRAYLCQKCGKRYLETVDFFEKFQRHTLDYEKYIFKLAKNQDINSIAVHEVTSWDVINDIFLKGSKKATKFEKNSKRNSRQHKHR